MKGETGEKYKGRNKKGIKRYNELDNIIKAQRETQASKELELVMKDKFAKIVVRLTPVGMVCNWTWRKMRKTKLTVMMK